MAYRTEATFSDKALLVPHFAKVVAAALYRGVVSGIFCIGGPKANTIFKDIVFAALRQNLRTINAAQEQVINPTTEATYLDLAKKEKFQPESTVLASGLKLHWLGSKSSKYTLLYFHGGGYALSCSPGHLQWLFDLQKDLSKDHSISVVLVGYTLSHQGQYPLQLKQAAESLSFLLNEHKQQPGNIILGGDSAGGHMTLSLLSHILHPHPEVPKIDLKHHQLASAILISPWVKFTADDESFKRNATSDMIPPEGLIRWASMFKGGKPEDEYNTPIVAKAEWWHGLNKIVKDIIVWGGGGEVLIDSINEITKKLSSAHPKVEIVVQGGAAHEDFIFDVLFGYKKKAEGTKVIESWIADRL